MKRCRECGCEERLEIDPKDPDHLTRWQQHAPGCSWSPMVAPAEIVHRWRMGQVRRTDSVQPESAEQEKP